MLFTAMLAMNSVPTGSGAGFPFLSSFSREICDTQHVFITILCFFFLKNVYLRLTHLKTSLIIFVIEHFKFLRDS